jgi:hypothetical protein
MYQQAHPAVNVKTYSIGWTAEKIAEYFKCSDRTAENASEWVWESACEEFWRYWGTDVDLTSYFPDHTGLEVFSEGRSSGWLVVHGLPELEDWDTALAAHWANFAEDVMSDVKYRRTWDYARETIEANGWAVDPVSCPMCGTPVQPDNLRGVLVIIRDRIRARAGKGLGR